MYEQFYHFSEDPFRLMPDPRYAFAHPSYAKARAYLEYGVQRGEGFVAITGPPGSGKTTLIEELLTRAPAGVRVSHLISSQLEAEDLLRMVAHSIGLRVDRPGKASLLNEIQEHLEADRSGGRRTVLIVDEAQGLDSAALEELRLLTNLSDPWGPLLQIILLGQEQLREILKRPELEQLRQRMIAAYHLKPMSEEDTKEYVAHRLRCADWSGDPVISDMAVRIIHHAGGGNPRRINLLCSRLLLHGYVGGKHYLAVPDVRIVLEEMEEEELASWDDSLEELMSEEEAREQEEEARLARINPGSGVRRMEASGSGARRAPEPLTTVRPNVGHDEPEPEPLHVDRDDRPAAQPPRRQQSSIASAPPEQRPPEPPPAEPRRMTQPPASEPVPGPLPDVEIGERLAEPISGRPRRGSPAPADDSGAKLGWEWLVGAVLVFLLAALVAATHDPTRALVSEWITDLRGTVASDSLPAGESGSGQQPAREEQSGAAAPED